MLGVRIHSVVTQIKAILHNQRKYEKLFIHFGNLFAIGSLRIIT